MKRAPRKRAHQPRRNAGPPRRPKVQPFTDDPPDALELIARMLVGSSYRVPVEGRSSRPTLTPADVSAAVGMVRDRVSNRAAIAVATRAAPKEVGSLALVAYRRIIKAVRWLRPIPLDLSEPADRWRARIIIYDAAHDLVWPEQRPSLAEAAKGAKMRRQAYESVYHTATAVLAEALEDGRRDFARRLWAPG